MKYLYSQKNPEWANLKMGKSGLTLKQAGCLITDCAMIISDLMGEPNTPEELLLWMNIYKGFDSQGNLKWDVLISYAIERLGLHQGQAKEGETEYLLFAVWVGKIKHWVINSDTGFIDPLSGTIIPKNKYPSANDTRLLSGKKLNTMPNYEGRIVQNTEAGTPEAGQFSYVQNGKRRVITAERSGLACLTVIDKQGEKVFALNSKNYHSIPLGKDF